MIKTLQHILQANPVNEDTIPLFGDFDLNPDLEPLFKKEVMERSLRKAATVIPLVVKDDDVYVFMTQRPSNFKAYPNLWCFPGGKVDASDASCKTAALREVKEETGIDAQNINILGKLPNFWVCSDIEGKPGFNLYPYVGVLKQPLNLDLNPEEVSNTVKIPLSFIMQPDNCKVVDGDYCFEYGEAVIKGASPALLVILRDLLKSSYNL